MAELSKENGLQKEAFELYYGLGQQRSLKAVALHFKRSERTVAGWSRDYRWVDRCSQRDIDEAKGKDKQQLMLDVKVKYRTFLNNLIAVATKDFAERKFKIKSVQDLERVMKLDLLLIGESVDSVVGDGEIAEEDRKVFENMIQLMQGLVGSTEK